MKQYFRTTKGKRLFGVCAGLGEYLQIDPVLIRVAFVILFLIGGFGGLVYILLALLAPLQNNE